MVYRNLVMILNDSGPSKIVVKSHEKSISMLESMSKNEKHLPKELQQNYCELIEVNRREVTIKR